MTTPQRALLAALTYDPGLGYPTRFFIDQSTRTADEEFWVETSGLTRRP